MSKPAATAVFPDATPLLRDALRQLGDAVAPLTIYDGIPDREELIRRVQGHRVVLNNESLFDESVLDRCPDLRCIVFLGTGASSYIDLDACARRHIRVETVANYGDRTVAEHTIALLFAIYRDLAGQHELIRAGGWGGSPIGELRGKTLGLIGFGAIAREVAAIGQALDMRVVAWSRSAIEQTGVTALPLDDLLSAADIVSLHLALTPETKGLLGSRELNLMKRGAVLINTARGALVDENALIQVLETGHIAGAGLDVFTTEPLDVAHPLKSVPHVALSCHTGWQSPEAISRLVAKASDLVLKALGDHMDGCKAGGL